MWTRAQLKHQAKQVLSKSYWSAFLVALVLGIASGSLPASVTGIVSDFAPMMEPEMLLLLGGVLALTGVFSLVITLFVFYPLQVGAHRYFLESTQYRFDLGNIAHGFTGGGYFNQIGTLFLRDLFTGLWTMLFIIPGIIKSYAYSMTPYILAENPNLSAPRAITISRDITRGYRFKLFVLDLSFIGWNLLGALCFGIGTLFVAPYYQATRAQMYLALRTEAVNRGILDVAELTPER